MESFSNLSIKADDKDKIIKVVQNLAKFTSNYLYQSNPELSTSLLALSNLSRDSRKLFNLFRSLKEFNEINNSILNKEKYITLSYADIILKISKFFFYLFDNLSLISSLKLISLDKLKTGIIGNLFYTSITVCNISKSLYTLYSLLDEKEKREKNILSLPNIKDEKDKELNYKIVMSLVDISGKLCDLLMALNNSGLIQMIFGGKIKDSIIAFGGVWAGIVSIMQVLQKS